MYNTGYSVHHYVTL